jgi:DNA-binding HxlR family transcriptional regulator
VFLGLRRFDELQASLGITRSVLATRLEHLVREGVLERVRYQTRPDRYEYRATAKGLELWPVLVHLLGWGDRHYAGESGPPRIIEHVDCGGQMDRDLCCNRCGARLRPDSTTTRLAERALVDDGHA